MQCKDNLNKFKKLFYELLKQKEFYSYSKLQFNRNYNGGWWIIKIVAKYSKALNGFVVSFPFGFHLVEIEKIVSALCSTKYSSKSITGWYPNIGEMFDNKCFYEVLIKDNTNVNDVVNDVMYYFEKYVEPIISKYQVPEEFYCAMDKSRELYSALNAEKMYFQYAAIFLIKKKYEKAYNVLDSIQEKYYLINSTTKENCKAIAKQIQESKNYAIDT